MALQMFFTRRELATAFLFAFASDIAREKAKASEPSCIKDENMAQAIEAMDRILKQAHNSRLGADRDCLVLMGYMMNFNATYRTLLNDWVERYASSEAST